MKDTSIRLIAFNTGLFILFYVVSLHYSALYIDTSGDPFHYQNFYDNLVGAEFSEFPYLQFRYTGSAEPAFGALMWVFAHFFERPTIIAIMNGFFAILLVKGLRHLNTHPFMIALVLSNYYWFVLLLAAERLKFAFLMLTLFFVAKGSKKLVFALLAPLFHVQTVIIYGVFITQRLADSFLQILRTRKIKWLPLFEIIAFISFVVFVGIWLQDRIAVKISSYSGASDNSIWKSLAMMLLSLTLTRERIKALLLFAPLIFLAYMLGGSRINMIAFLVLAYYAVTHRRGLNITGIAVFSYFSVKGFMFLNDITVHGTGYP